MVGYGVVEYAGKVYPTGDVSGPVKFYQGVLSYARAFGEYFADSSKSFYKIPSHYYTFSIARLGPLATGQTQSGPLTAAAVAGPPQASSSAARGVILAGAATQLVVTTPPDPNPVTAGSPFGLVVQAEDGSGNLDPNYNGNVTIAATDETLYGPTTVTAVNGVATFTGLTLDYARPAVNGPDETLEITAGGLAGTSPHITVNPGPPAQFSAFAPASVASGAVRRDGRGLRCLWQRRHDVQRQRNRLRCQRLGRPARDHNGPGHGRLCQLHRPGAGTGRRLHSECNRARRERADLGEPLHRHARGGNATGGCGPRRRAGHR